MAKSGIVNEQELHDLFPDLSRSQENVGNTSQDQLDLSGVLKMADDCEDIPVVYDLDEEVKAEMVESNLGSYSSNNEVKSDRSSLQAESEGKSTITKISKRPTISNKRMPYNYYVLKKKHSPLFIKFKELYDEHRNNANHVAFIISTLEISKREYRNLRDRYKNHRLTQSVLDR